MGALVVWVSRRAGLGGVGEHEPSWAEEALAELFSPGLPAWSLSEALQTPRRSPRN